MSRQEQGQQSGGPSAARGRRGLNGGLSALEFSSQDKYGLTFDADGVIFPDEFPDCPELSSAE